MNEIEQLPKGAKLINGFPFYCVTPTGIVYSCRTRGGQFRAWTPMKQFLNPGGNKGRLFVCLRNGRKAPHPKSIHLLVLTHFKGPCPQGMEGCHNDGKRENNNVTNLRWDTHKNNMADRDKHGTSPKGVLNGEAILTEDQVREIRRRNKAGEMQKTLAPIFGVAKQTIQAVCSRVSWAHIIEESEARGEPVTA